MKATFFERLGAYIIDSIIITLILVIIGLGNQENTEKYQKQLEDVQNQYIAGEITSEEFVKEYEIVVYNEQKDNILSNCISLTLTIAYFVIFQYLNNGQTLGKKLLKIRVVNNDTNNPENNILKGLLRTFIPYNITSSIFGVIFIKLCNQSTYFTMFLSISAIEGIFFLICICFILYRKDGRGLHDVIANTKVIHEK